jgi:hypothetical protein
MRALVVVLGLQGCLGCTEVGCVNDTQVTFSGELADGTWDVTLDVEGNAGTTCTFLLEDGVSTLEPDSPGACGPRTLRPDGYGTPTVRPDGAFAQLHLTRLEDGVDVTVDVDLSTSTFYPNGKRCGPECTNSGGVATLPDAVMAPL